MVGPGPTDAYENIGQRQIELEHAKGKWTGAYSNFIDQS